MAMQKLMKAADLETHGAALRVAPVAVHGSSVEKYGSTGVLARILAMSSASHKDARGDGSSCGWRDSARSSSSLPRRRGRSSSPTLVQSSYR